MNDVNSDDQQHIIISTALPVPFTKGLTQLFRCDEHNILSRLSLVKILGNISEEHKVPHSFVQGELIRYLFSFSQNYAQIRAIYPVYVIYELYDTVWC